MVTHSYVQSSKMGPDGKMITEKYFDKNHVGKGADGKTVEFIFKYFRSPKDSKATRTLAME